MQFCLLGRHGEYGRLKYLHLVLPVFVALLSTSNRLADAMFVTALARVRISDNLPR